MGGHWPSRLVKTCDCIRGWSPEVLVMSPGWLKARQSRVPFRGASAAASTAAPSGSDRLYLSAANGNGHNSNHAKGLKNASGLSEINKKI